MRDWLKALVLPCRYTTLQKIRLCAERIGSIQQSAKDYTQNQSKKKISQLSQLAYEIIYLAHKPCQQYGTLQYSTILDNSSALVA